MKTLILLVLCALVATTYAAPGIFWNQAKTDMSEAELQGFFGSLLKLGKKALPHVIKAVGGGVEVQDDDDDDDDNTAIIEALLSSMQKEAQRKAALQSLQDRAVMEGWGSFLGKKK